MRSILFLLILVMIGLNGKGQSVTALPDSVLSQCCLEVTLLNGNLTTVDWVFIQYITRDGTGTKLFVEYAPNFGGIQWETQIRIQDDFDEVIERSKFIMLPFTVGSTDYGINRNWIANIEENTTTGGTWIYGRFGSPTKRKFSAVEDYETLKNLLLACRPRAIVVAENGLYTEGDTVRMGGFLIEQTTITTEGYNWVMKDTLSSQSFGIDYNSYLGDTSFFISRRWGKWRNVFQQGRNYLISEIEDTTVANGRKLRFINAIDGIGDLYFFIQYLRGTGSTQKTNWFSLAENASFWTVNDKTTNPYYTQGLTINQNSAAIASFESGGPGYTGSGVSVSVNGSGAEDEWVGIVTKGVDNGTATNGQFLQLVDNSNGKVEFSTINLSGYLPVSDTASMLAPYVDGAGAINRVPIFTGSRTLGNSNLQDNNTVLSILNNKPFQFGTWTTAGRPTEVRGYWGYNTTDNGPEWHNGTRWAKVLESSITTGLPGQVLHIDANGQATGSANLTWNNGLIRSRRSTGNGILLDLGSNDITTGDFIVETLSGGLGGGSKTWRIRGNNSAGPAIEATGGNGGIILWSNLNVAQRVLTGSFDLRTELRNDKPRSSAASVGSIVMLTNAGQTVNMQFLPDGNNVYGNVAAIQSNQQSRLNTSIQISTNYNYNHTALSVLSTNLSANIANGFSQGVLINPTFTASSTSILSGNITNPGSGMTNGTYNDIPLQIASGSAWGAVANITVSGGVITNVTLVNGGTGFSVGNVLTINHTPMGGFGFQYTVTSVGTATNTTKSNVRLIGTGNDYSVYSSSSAPSYFNGNIGIKTLSTTEGLDVDDDVRIRDSLRLSQAALNSKILQTDANGWVKPLVLSGMDYTDGTLRANSVYNLLPIQDVTVSQATPDTFKLAIDGTFDVLGEDRKGKKYGAQPSEWGQGTLGAAFTVGREGYWAEIGIGTDSIQTPLNLFAGNIYRGDGFGMELALGGFRSSGLGTGKKHVGYAGIQWFTDYFNTARSIIRLKTADKAGNFYYNNFKNGTFISASLSMYNAAYDDNQYDGIPSNSVISENFLSVGRGLYPTKRFTVFNNLGTERASIDSSGVMRLNTCGAGNRTAAALGLTESNYFGLATNGTIIDMERKRDTTIYVIDTDYDFSAALTTAQIARRYNRVIFLMTTTGSAGSDSELTLHTPDINLMQVEYLVRSTDEAGGFTNVIRFGTNNAVDSTNGLVSSYFPAAGQGVGIRAGLRSGVYKYWYY